MKKIISLLYRYIYICLYVLFLFVSCQNSFWPIQDKTSQDLVVVPKTEEHCVELNSQITEKDETIKLEMIKVDFENSSFDYITLGEDVEDVTKKVEVKPFKLSKYEVSYNLWYEVRVWAEENGYIFENKGAEGARSNNSFIDEEDFYNQGGDATDKGIPVIGINWRDAVVWCNAFSEMSGLICVYYTDSEMTIPIRNSIYSSESAKKDSGCPLPYGKAMMTDMISLAKGNIDNPYVNKNANGFRLPYNAEWEYAARKMPDGSFIDGCNAPGDTTGAVSGSNEPTIEEQIQGITPKPVSKARVLGTYGWSCGYNSGSLLSSKLDGPEKTAAGWNDLNSASKNYKSGCYRVHKQGGKKPSGLGFYDLAGNVFEWCFNNGADYDWEYEISSSKTMKSSTFCSATAYFASSARRSDPSYVKIGGMRLARNIE